MSTYRAVRRPFFGVTSGYLGVCATMVAAMLFSPAGPMVLLFHRVSGERAKRGQQFVPTWVSSSPRAGWG